MSRYSQYSPILRRSKKLSCKNRGGVAREVSRRERHFPNTFTSTTSPSQTLRISYRIGSVHIFGRISSLSRTIFFLRDYFFLRNLSFLSMLILEGPLSLFSTPSPNKTSWSLLTEQTSQKPESEQTLPYTLLRSFLKLS